MASSADYPLFDPTSPPNKRRNPPPDIYSAFRVRIRSSSPHAVFLPQVCWPGRPDQHRAIFGNELQCLQATSLQPSSQYSDKESITPLCFIHYDPPVPCMLAFAATGKLPPPDPLFYFERFFSSNLIDRTSTLHRPIPVKVLDPIPSFDPTFNLPLDAILDARAYNILRRIEKHNYDLKVLWAGDLESSVMLIAFLRNATSSQLHRLVVVCFEHCPRAAVSFVSKVIGKVPRMQIISNVSDIFCEPLRFQRAATLVSASHGELLLGSELYTLENYDMQPNDYVDYFFDIKNKADVDLDWQTFMPQYYAAKGVFPESAKDSWLLWIKPQVKRAPVPIRSVRDFLWWFSFSLQWQHATTWLHGFHALSGENAINDIEHFFATDDFQQWSYHNRTLESAKYKEVYCDYIYAYTFDKESFKLSKLMHANTILRAAGKSRRTWSLGLNSNFEHVGLGPIPISIQSLLSYQGMVDLVRNLAHSDMMDPWSDGEEWNDPDASKKILPPQRPSSTTQEGNLRGGNPMRSLAGSSNRRADTVAVRWAFFQWLSPKILASSWPLVVELKKNSLKEVVTLRSTNVNLFRNNRIEDVLTFCYISKDGDIVVGKEAASDAEFVIQAAGGF